MTANTAFPFGAAFERLTATLAHAASWAAVGSILGLVVIAGVIRLLTEWQRRLTIVAIVERAPKGTVVVQGCGPADAARNRASTMALIGPSLKSCVVTTELQLDPPAQGDNGPLPLIGNGAVLHLAALTGRLVVVRGGSSTG